MAVNLKIVSQVVTSGTPGPAGKSAYQIAVDNGFQGTESEWLKELHPFKGWFDSVSELEEEHSAPSVGEYAYVKGAASSDPVKIYECSTEGSWSDSGRTVDTSTVQTFRSGEAVNDVEITDDSSDIEENNDKIPTAGAVADALGNVEFSTGEKVKNVGIDAEPTAGSDNLVKSGGTFKKLNSNLEGIFLSNSLYNSLLLDTSTNITPTTFNSGVVRLNGVVEPNAYFVYSDIALSDGYIYNIAMWSGGNPNWCGVTLYDLEGNVLYNHIQGIDGHFIFPKTAVTLRVCTYGSETSRLLITKQQVLSTPSTIADLENDSQSLRNDYLYTANDLSVLNNKLITEGIDVVSYNATNGYYDINGDFQENSSYHSVEYSVKKNSVYIIDNNVYGGQPVLTAYDADNNILFSVLTRLGGVPLRFSSRVAKITLSTNVSWQIIVLEYYSSDTLTETQNLFKLKTGNNVFNRNKALSRHMIVKNSYTIIKDDNYSAFLVGEILNLYGETKICVQPSSGYQSCKISAIDKYGNLIINYQTISSSDPVDITGSYRILVQGRVDNGYMMVNFGETALPYEDYYEYYDIKVSSSYTSDHTSPTNLPDIRIDNRKSMRITSSTLASDSTLQITDYPKYVKKSCNVSFEGKITNFSSILIYLDGGGRVIKIDSTKIYSQNRSGGTYTSANHGLTISDYIRVVIKYSISKTTIILSTKGGVFTKDWTDSTSDMIEFYGRPTVKTDENTLLTDIVLSGTSDDFIKNVWVVGDSLVSVYDVRWTYYPLVVWKYNNWLLQGLAGGSSDVLWEDLQKSLTLGCPKIIVWLLGTNDTNSDYQTTLDLVVSYCNKHNIELILGKFPDPYGISNNEKKSFSVKNTYMLTKNKRYIDFRKAVTEQEGVTYQGVTIGKWYGDDLSLETPPEGSYIGNDRVHPSVIGAEAEAVQVLIDVPELMQL